jgi:hypothetical protein
VARGPGLLFLVASIVIAAVGWRITVRTGVSFDPALVQSQTFSALKLFMILIATAGIASTDVHQGFYRAWFSKPMAPWWYYLQRYVIGGLFVLATPVVYGAALAILTGKGAGLSVALFVQLGLAYLLVGSAVFLLSTLYRWDWLVVLILSSAQATIHGFMRFGGDGVPQAVVIAYKVLPPFHHLTIGGPTISGGALWHVLGYSGGMLVLAIAVLLTKPLGSGGRA